jgi:hypothetical protein
MIMRKRERERHARTADALYELSAALLILTGKAGELYEGEGIDIIKKNARRFIRATGHAYVTTKEISRSRQ